MNKIFYIAILILSLAACQKKQIQYQTFEVTTRTLLKKIEANGSVESKNTVEIYPTVPGRLEQLFVKVGDMVHAKQKIGTMSSETRTTILDMASSKSKEESDYWRKQLLLTPIFTSVAGKIIVLKADIGEKLSGSIGQVSTGEIIRANVDEADLPSIVLGQKVEIHFDIDPKKTLVGKLETISQTSKLVSNVNVYQVEVSLPDAESRKKIPFEIKIGMSVTLYFRVNEKKNALALPINAVSGKSQANMNVTKLDGTRTKIKLGDVYGDWVEVVSGLSSGEKIKIPAFNIKNEKTRKSPLMMKQE